MRPTSPPILLLALLSVAPVVAAADETALKLVDGPELATVQANCSVCHSLDYVQMNAPFLKRVGWEAEVRKMIKVMGAPVSDEDAAKILAYLTRSYGVD